MKFWWPTGVACLTIACMSAIFIVALRDARHPAETLPDRINAACPPGWHVVDWSTGNEYNPVPAGTVRVTCEDKAFHTQMVAVER